MSSSPLGEAVSSFLSAASEQLAALSGKPADGFLADAANEAANIVGGVIAADGRTTDGELTAYVDVIGPLLSPPLLTSTVAARDLQLFRGKTVDVHNDSLVIEATGSPDKLAALLEMLKPYGIRELVQSGVVALGRGSKSLTDRPKDRPSPAGFATQTKK